MPVMSKKETFQNFKLFSTRQRLFSVCLWIYFLYKVHMDFLEGTIQTLLYYKCLVILYTLTRYIY